MSTRYGSFLVALPDVETGIEQLLPTRANVKIEHSSGRPWLLARIPPSHLLAFVKGRTRIAILGQTSAIPSDIERIARRVQSPRHLASETQVYHGSYIVVASQDGATYASGPAAQTRRIFHARVGETRIVSDRADLLAHLGGFRVSDEALALRLAGDLPHPANDVPMWREVRAVPGGDFVVMDREGTRVRSTTWWSRPQPTLARPEAAAGLRQALQDSVAVRTRSGVNVACDLSGGLDSTPLCYFAAQGPSGVVARTFYTEDPGGREDLRWARLALPSMPGVREHQTFSTEGLPDFFEGLDASSYLDEPTQAAAAAPRIQHMLDDDVRLGITTHLTGLGGDHLFRGLKLWNHALARRMPLTAWQRSRAEDAATGVPMHVTLLQLLDHRSYGQWFAQATRDAIDDIPLPDLPRLNDWSVPFQLPPWFSSEARDSVIEMLHTFEREAQPLGPDVASHFDISTLREAGRAARGTSFLGEAVGVSYDAPLLDDKIVESVLATRFEERDSPLEWKPLMKAAMKGLLPDSYLRRTSKIGGGPQSVRGYSKHYRHLMHLWEDSGLLERGLVDRDRLLQSVVPSDTKAPPLHARTLTDVAIFLRDWQCNQGQAVDVS